MQHLLYRAIVQCAMGAVQFRMVIQNCELIYMYKFQLFMGKFSVNLHL